MPAIDDRCHRHRDRYPVVPAGRAPMAMRRAPAGDGLVPSAIARAAARTAFALALGCGPALAQSPGQSPGGSPAVAPSSPVPAGVSTPAPGRLRVGLALSGGGARGFAHVGVLRVLEEMRVPVDCIAGTSAGSAVGAAYASGLSPDEIEQALRSADWDRDMFDDSPPRRDQQPRRRNEEKAYLLDLTFGYRDGSVLMPPGLISGQKIELFLHRMLGASARLDSFDRLPIPFRAIATDLENGEMVVQDRGSLVTAVRASMAVPSAFAPVKSGDRLLVDGGLTRNMPVDIVRNLCADVVIAVDISSGLLTRKDLGGVLAVASQMVGILMERNMRESREQVRSGVDVMIKPELDDIGSASFSRGVEGIPAGAAAARVVAPELARLAMSAQDYAAWAQNRRTAFARDDRYTGVRVVGTGSVNASTLLSQSGLARAGTLDRPALERAVNAWNSSGDYDRIGYSLIPDGPNQILQLDVVEREWGPNYLRFGLGAAADSTGNGVFNVMLGYRRPNFNSLGGEFRSELQFGTTQRFVAEVFQPVNRGSARFFLNPQLLFEEVPVWLFNDRKRIAEYGVRTSQLGLDLGVQGRYGEARLGVFGGTRTELPRTGSVIWPRINEGFWGAQLAASVDQLDATDFPRDGYLLGLNLRVEDVSPERGDAYMARRIQLVGKQVASWGDHTFAAAFRVGEANDRLGLNQLFSLGGFMNLSGLQINQVLGTSLRYASLSYQNQILTLPNPLGRGVYAGLALESATMRGPSLGVDTNGWLSGLTAFLGAHTGIGPVYLGYGYAQGGNRLIYLFLGRPGL